MTLHVSRSPAVSQKMYDHGIAFAKLHLVLSKKSFESLAFYRVWVKNMFFVRLHENVMVHSFNSGRMRKLHWVVKPKIHVTWPHTLTWRFSTQNLSPKQCFLHPAQGFGHQLMEIRRWRFLVYKSFAVLVGDVSTVCLGPH